MAKESYTTSAGGVVINDKGEVVVVSSKGSTFWSLPKGHVDPGEDAITAAKREIYEESGISQLEFIRELGTYERYKRGLDGNDILRERKLIVLFLFKTDEKKLEPKDPHNPEARWVKKEEVSKLLTHQKDKEFFEKIRPTL